MPRHRTDGISRLPGVAFLAPFGCFVSLSCTAAEGEVGVYVAPQETPREAAVFHVPRPDSGPPTDGQASNLCLPGRYDGTFSCNFLLGAACEQNFGTGGLVVTGPLSLTLTPSSGTEFLVVSGGTLDASSGGFTLNGPLSGNLECRTGTFTGSFDGIYSGPALPPLPALNGQLSGPIQSGYDSRQPALTNGTWCLTATNPNTSRTDPCADIPSGQPGSCLAGSCQGTWAAVYVPGT